MNECDVWVCFSLSSFDSPVPSHRWKGQHKLNIQGYKVVMCQALNSQSFPGCFLVIKVNRKLLSSFCQEVVICFLPLRIHLLFPLPSWLLHSQTPGEMKCCCKKKNVTFGIPFHFPIIGELKREVLGLLNIQLRRKLGWGQND